MKLLRSVKSSLQLCIQHAASHSLTWTCSSWSHFLMSFLAVSYSVHSRKECLTLSFSPRLQFSLSVILHLYRHSFSPIYPARNWEIMLFSALDPNECLVLWPTLGLNVYRFLSLSVLSHLSCHFMVPDSYAAIFTSSASFASWAASFASRYGCSFPLRLACPGDQDSSTSTTNSCNFLSPASLLVLYSRICFPS